MSFGVPSALALNVGSLAAAIFPVLEVDRTPPYFAKTTLLTPS
jgi:hypothetical protein